MSRRLRVYLTMSLRDAEMLQDGIELLMTEGEYLDRIGHEHAATRFGKMGERLAPLIEAQRPSLGEGLFDGPPDDYDPDQGGT